ncbi:Putative ribonuclease H protein At1g65750 [Linum grandiflorum]
MIKVLAWNCRGAGHENFVTAFKRYSTRNNPTVVIICEPRISGDRAVEVISRMGYDEYVRVDAVGFRGGIWVLWRTHEVSLSLIASSSQFIHLEGKSNELGSFFLTAIYGNPSVSRRNELWDALRSIEGSMTSPWMLIGDFNALLSANEKQGGAVFSRRKHQPFINCVADCGLLDGKFKGPRFTWRWGHLQQRLDRCLFNSAWITKFPESHVLHLPRIKSDHRPIMMITPVHRANRLPRPFRFFAAWLGHPDFKEFVNRCWNSGDDLPPQLSLLASGLRRWNKDVFGIIEKRKAGLEKRLEEAEIATSDDSTLIGAEMAIRRELEDTLRQEELLWLQKSRNEWNVDGDRNTKFFHLTTLRRRARNRITCLKDNSGLWVTNTEDLVQLAVSYFSEFYRDNQIGTTLPIEMVVTLLPCQAARLARPILIDEVWNAVREMGPLKAPGVDGFQPIFYQKCWEVVGVPLANFVANVFREPERIRAVNETLLVLIPKIARPSLITHFRPISLCNVSYKVVTKCIANRLKGLMSHLVHPSQTSFVPGRHITDNIIIMQEVVHSMHGRKGKIGQMVLKIDLAKAYDKISWKFVEETLNLAGIPNPMVSLIMECISTVSFRILWNGGATDSFVPGRGLRQGCPLSPYLFTLCIERLSQLIRLEEDSGSWKSIELARRATKLTHIFFADDLVLFGEASTAQARVVTEVLDKFCLASGQTVSKEKSCVYFSKNVSNDLADCICVELGIARTANLGRYLGMPVIHGRPVKGDYEFILDNIDRRLAGWKAKTLSLAGRVTLATSVLNAIPSFAMQTVALPDQICVAIDKKIRSFVWGSTQEQRKIHLISWDSICRPKDQGGLGLRSARELNKAYILKVAWGLMKRPEELWARVLISKYLKQSTNGLVERGTKRSTALWRGIKDSWELLSLGSRWSIRDGKETKFWTDSWLDSGIVLAAHARVSALISDDILVADICDDAGKWNVSFLNENLSANVVEQVLGMTPPSAELGNDKLVWGLEPNGMFSIKSAYILIKQLNDVDTGKLWRKVWTWQGPNKIRHFLWLASHDRLLTNVERRRRHLYN